ncbi:resistance to inhibitors of cholinesterase protein 3 isoform X3 [Episyrphus balteatus]|uniref:resistance to inhibitors of cholinesterase protein 3 isoform X3 n=1 Tax=Episyrphus balteatus TaxID=286459 RepID=UPI0024855AB7|nr:resistance to inhibitors of cholinesterase protein 3 isoform X3 [Episyrphus balteatus]
MKKAPTQPVHGNECLGSKKTAIIVITVVGCIAILWPKVFHPMMFGGALPKPTPKEHRLPGGCCDVVLDREKFLNSTPFEVGPHLYRKQLNLLTGELSLRQERPSHLHPESIYQSMKERGRAIPATPTVPIIERAKSTSNPPPRIVEGRPGPIPGMRPPMGAGSVHQAQPKGSSMGLIMPLYTIGIIVFFVYTIMKIVFKKPIPNAPYGPAPADPTFRKEVFGQDKKADEQNGTKLGWREHHTRSNQQQELCSRINCQDQRLRDMPSSNIIVATNGSSQSVGQSSSYQLAKSIHPINKESEQLMEIEKLRKKLEETEKAMAKLIAEMNSDQFQTKETNDKTMTLDSETISNGQTNINECDDPNSIEKSVGAKPLDDVENSKHEVVERKKRDGSVDRSVASSEKLEDPPVPQSIYLEGSLGHDSQILVSDSETRTEEVFDKELNGSPEEPAVVLSSKMTLSLINLDAGDLNNHEKTTPASELESPLADDIEIIGHDEN